jgi:hypothetical protein
MIVNEEIVYTDTNTVLVITTYDNGEEIIVEYTIDEYQTLTQQ